MENYNLQKAANRFAKFIDDLTNWYIRRSRRRFWKSQNDNDKNEAYAVLHHVLLVFAEAAAPFIPFITEEIYRNLRTPEMPVSVHLCDYPLPDASIRDPYLETQMELTMNTVSLGRYLRTQSNLKVRQPLAKAIIVAAGEKRQMLQETAWIIQDELNVKAIEFSNDEDALVVRSAKANFKALGGRLGKNMKEAANLISQFTSREIGEILNGSAKNINLNDGSQCVISADDLIVKRDELPGVTVATGNGVTIALATEITPELEAEGFAREFVSKIQNLRKESMFEVADRIKIEYQAAAENVAKIAKFAEYIGNETLAVELNAVSELTSGMDLDVNGANVRVVLNRI